MYKQKSVRNECEYFFICKIHKKYNKTNQH